MQMQRECIALSPEKQSIEKWYCVAVSFRQGATKLLLKSKL